MNEIENEKYISVVENAIREVLKKQDISLLDFIHVLMFIVEDQGVFIRNESLLKDYLDFKKSKMKLHALNIYLNIHEQLNEISIEKFKKAGLSIPEEDT